MLINSKDQERDAITVRLAKQTALTQDKVCQVLLENYPELQAMVTRDQILVLDVEFVGSTGFEYVAGSGKLREIIDRRQRQ